MENNVKDFILLFTSILYEAMPFIVLGVVIAGFLEELVPQELIPRLWFFFVLWLKKRLPRWFFRRLLPILVPVLRFLTGTRPRQIALSAFLGLLFPMCECGIIPVMRRLLRKGLPLSCCTSYLLAGPIINVVVMLSTFMAFSGMENDEAGRRTHQMGGIEMMVLRMVLGFLVAFGTSLIVDWQYRKHGNKLLAPMAVADTTVAAVEDDPTGLPVPARPWRARMANISETALHDFVDIMVFLTLGALLAAFSRQVLRYYEIEEQVANMSRSYPLLAIGAMMIMAIVLCICSEADAFVAASFRALPPSSKLAFLVLGPMLDFKLYMMYTRVFRPRLIWTIILSVVLQTLIYSLITHYVWEMYGYRFRPSS